MYYIIIGPKLLLLGCLYGGSDFPFMHESVFEYLIYQSIDTSIVSMENIPDRTLKLIIENVNF